VQAQALLIGNSDGIGLAATKRLLAAGWKIFGISRSESSIIDTSYQHRIADVRERKFKELLAELCREASPDLCIYFVGIGEELDLLDMSREPEIFDVNLIGMVRTAAAVIPQMIRKEKGHFIGVSSFADELLSAEAPSYHASKAGFSSYLRSLAIATAPLGVQVTNIRYGFVDTKMAKGDFKPFMMSAEKAVDHLEKCIRKTPVNYAAPKIDIPLIKFRRMMMRMGAK